MKEIEKTIKKLGYKKTGKDACGSQMFEKGMTIIYLNKITFKAQKKETFKEISARMYK